MAFRAMNFLGLHLKKKKGKAPAPHLSKKVRLAASKKLEREFCEVAR